MTASASARAGTSRGWANDTASTRRAPAFTSRPISSTLALVDRTTGSFWSPSRGLTSTIVSWRIRRSPLVRRAGAWAEFGHGLRRGGSCLLSAPAPRRAAPGDGQNRPAGSDAPGADRADRHHLLLGRASLRAVRPQRPGLPRRLHLGPLVRARRARGNGGGLGLRGVRAGTGGEPVRRRPGGLRAGRDPGGQGGWRGRVAAAGPGRAGRARGGGGPAPPG